MANSEDPGAVQQNKSFHYDMHCLICRDKYDFMGMKYILQPCNWQDSKEVVHELEFGDMAVMQI